MHESKIDREIPRLLVEQLNTDSALEVVDGQIIMITGPSCSGKSYIMQKFFQTSITQMQSHSVITDGYDLETKLKILSDSSEIWLKWLKGKKYLLIDDAHRLPGVIRFARKVAKLLPNLRIFLVFSTREVDNFQVIRVYPVALSELRKLYNTVNKEELIKDMLVFGSLPAVIEKTSRYEKIQMLKAIISKDILRDLFELERVNQPKILFDMLHFLADKLNENINLSEISIAVNANYRTVVRYLEVLKKYYIIHVHNGYRHASKREVNKLSKFYFYDNGIRNAFLNDFSDIDQRNDFEALWANFLVMERHKSQGLHHISHTNALESYFWKEWESDEIDLLEVGLGEFKKKFGTHAFKFVYNSAVYSSNSYKPPKAFLHNYPDASIEVITPQNCDKFI